MRILQSVSEIERHNSESKELGNFSDDKSGNLVLENSTGSKDSQDHLHPHIEQEN
jgi:hypothetical protein